VCASSIGCKNGVVNLYDSLFYDVILDDLQQQVENLVGEDFRGINVVPIQQQSNGSDCGVFAIAFATNLVYTLDPNIPQFNILQMRAHLHACLKAGLITPFPTAEST
jgi:Ulp1 family protease